MRRLKLAASDERIFEGKLVPSSIYYNTGAVRYEWYLSAGVGFCVGIFILDSPPLSNALDTRVTCGDTGTSTYGLFAMEKDTQSSSSTIIVVVVDVARCLDLDRAHN